MGRISIEEIKSILEHDNWQLLSEEYQNLDSNLEFKCNEGHVVIAPWKKIRDSRICPTCMKNSYKVKEFKNTKKKKGEYRVLALDQATHISGFSVFINKKLVDYGIFESQGETDIERCAHVKEWMESLIHTYEIDFVGFEGIQYQKSMGVTTFETLARLQGILMEACYELKIPFNFVNTNTWRLYCGVQGKSRPDRKRSCQLLIKKWFNISVTEDEADGIAIGKYFSDNQAPKVEIIDWENN